MGPFEGFEEFVDFALFKELATDFKVLDFLELLVFGTELDFEREADDELAGFWFDFDLARVDGMFVVC